MGDSVEVTGEWDRDWIEGQPPAHVYRLRAVKKGHALVLADATLRVTLDTEQDLEQYLGREGLKEAEQSAVAACKKLGELVLQKMK
jgi:hypothetical protein